VICASARPVVRARAPDGLARRSHALFTEPVWISGRGGEAMICGGCHEDRAHPVPVAQNQIAQLAGRATAMFGTTPRNQRQLRLRLP
jgi:cytochrome c553